MQTLGCKVMVPEIPDDPHPRGVAMARWVLLAMGMLCFVLATAFFFGRLIGPTWAFICLAALGALLLLAALCGRFGLWLSFFSSWSARLQPSSALERTSIE
jgi:hypothetical protein